MPPPAPSSRLVLVSPHREDHNTMRQILHPPTWKIDSFSTGREGLDFLRNRHNVAVVICEKRLPDAEWSQILGQLEGILNKPIFIVSARLADDRLWAEALNLGAFDVLLSSPFDPNEVIRVTESAWVAWNRTCGQSVVPRTLSSVDLPLARTEFKTRAATWA